MAPTSATAQYPSAYLKQSRGYQQIVTGAIFGFLALISVLGRLAARRSTKAGYGLDDALVIAAMVFGTALVITTCMLPAYGIGDHIVTLTPYDLEEIGKISFAFEIAYIPTLALSKLSVLALYRRVFASAPRWFHVGVWALAIYTILWTIGVFLDIFLECQPLHTIWTAGCAPHHATTISTGVLNIVSDLLIILLPQPIIWKLQMPIRQKFAVSCIFMLGLFATIISIIRIPLILDTGNAGNPDITYSLVTTDLLTVLEPLVVIICVCIPVLQTLVRGWIKTGMGLNTLRSLVRGQLSRESKSLQNLQTPESGSEQGSDSNMVLDDKRCSAADSVELQQHQMGEAL